MVTQSIDTTPEMERRQITMIREATVSKRLLIARSLSSSIITLSKRAIQRTRPDMSQRDVNLAFLEYHYGIELSKSVREYLSLKHR